MDGRLCAGLYCDQEGGEAKTGHQDLDNTVHTRSYQTDVTEAAGGVIATWADQLREQPSSRPMSDQRFDGFRWRPVTRRRPPAQPAQPAPRTSAAGDAMPSVEEVRFQTAALPQEDARQDYECAPSSALGRGVRGFLA